MAVSKMMEHYLSVKDQYQDCLVFYRLGDFYEMFFDDAVKASQILGLTLTGRDCGMEKRAPMCGVPYHAVDAYIAKLVSNGCKVAICEQLEDASQAKGIVKRDVVRVITAGTISGESLDEKTNNYLCSVFKKDDNIGFAWADITTGELSAAEFLGEDSINKVVALMSKLEVKEIIANEEMLLLSKSIPEVSRGVIPALSSYPEWAYGYNAAEKTLLEQFKIKTLTAFSIADKKYAVCAAGALIEYLKDTQMHALGNINGVRFVRNDRYMQLDNTAIKNLELVRNLGNGAKYGSLLWLLDKTDTPMGARMLNSAIISPLCDKEAIDYRLNGVGELYDATVIRLAVKELLKQIRDVERITGKISDGSIMPKDCLMLAQSLAVIPALKFRLSGFNSEIIRDINSGLVDMNDIVKLLNDAIVVPSTDPKEDEGIIKKGFNEQLDELKNIVKNAKGVISDMETRERDATGIRTLKIHYNRVFGYYIEVSKSFADKVPIHYQRRQTLANSERFTTEELKQLENKILSSGDLVLKLETEIYNKIKEVLFDRISDCKKVSEAIAKLDLIATFAEVSQSNRYVRPQILDSGNALSIKDGRHPVVEVISKERFINNDIFLDNGENRTMIITGPNMAGKSTYMRQTALIAIMAHIGCFVPAKSAQIPLIDRVFTRVGASDNLISDQSTFMVEMIEVASIIRNATKDSLLILDEVGRGTSTYDGLSIAWAVIEYLNNEIGAKTMFATHYHELTELESKLYGVKNFKIAVKEINGSVVFLRKIMRGGANRSFGIEVAALAGIPSEVTTRAKAILKMVEKGEKKVVDYAEEKTDEETPSEVEIILRDVDINTLSPMQAFLLVSDLVEKVKK